MVLKEGNVAISQEALAAQQAVSKIHKMPWLKDNNNPARHNSKEDEMSANVRNGNKVGKKSKSKNAKPAYGQKTQGRNDTPQQQQLGNAWRGGNRTVAELFLNREPASDLPEEMDPAMKLAIEESIRMMNDNLTIAEDNKRVEEAKERTAEDDYWSGKALKNLPSPVSQEIQKTSDTNNNSSAGKSSVSSSARKVPDRPTDHSSARPNSSSYDEKAKAVEVEEAIKKSSDKLLCAPPEKPHYVDQYDRIDGQNERRMFMGRGARKKEQMYLHQQQQEYQRLQQQHGPQQQAMSRSSNEATPSHREAKRHDSSRTNNEYSTRDTRNSKTPSRRPPTDGPGSRSFSSDKYHYVRDQSKPHSEHPERQTSENHQKRDIPEKYLPPMSNTPGVLAKGIESSARSDIPVDEKLRLPEVLSSSQTEKNDESSVNSTEKVLRLTGFNSRLNTPVNDELLDSLKPQTEVAAPSCASVESCKNHSTEVDSGSSWKAEIPHCSHQPPPGFSCPQLRPATNFPQNYEPRAPNLYDRLAIHDPSLHRFLQQSDFGNGRQTQTVGFAKDNFAVREDYWRSDNGEKTCSFVTQEAQISSYQAEETPNDYAVEAQPYMMREQFVADDRVFSNDLRCDSNFLHVNEQAPGGYDGSAHDYSQIAPNLPKGCVFVSYPYAHGPVPFQHPLQACIPAEYLHDENLVPPTTPRLHLRSTVPQYSSVPSPTVYSPQGVPDSRLDPHSRQLDFDNNRYQGQIMSQQRFIEPAHYPNNRVVNFSGNRGFHRPHAVGSQGIPLNLSRGPRHSNFPQQRYIPDTGHGRGRV